MKKKVIITVSIIVAVFLLGIFAGSAAMSLDGFSVSSGTALISENGTCFLIKENSPIRLSDYSEKGDKLKDIESGDKLWVIHDGVNESYPASTAVYYVFRTGKGNVSEIPENVISSLKELGWLVSASDEKSVSIEFTEKYVRTGTPQYDISESIDFPLLTVFENSDELGKYIRDNEEKYSLGSSFSEAAKEYDDGFFSDSTLLLCFVEEGSGSNSHEIREILVSDGKTDIFLNTITPETGTCDMAYHHIFIAVKKSDIKDTDVRLIFNGRKNFRDGKSVIMGRDFANFSLTLPESWDYEEINDVNNEFFGVSIYNSAAPESTVTIEFDNFFGVCGTGLRTEAVTINGYKAHMGIYDGNPAFDYIVFEDTPGYYVIKNNADSSWWHTYEEELREIFSTLKIADGIIFREAAFEIASKNSVGEYKRKITEYDYKKGIWTITFVKEETEQVVLVDHTGNLL